MTTLTILTITFLAVVAVVLLVKLAVQSDGYGRRARPPASHWPDVFGKPDWYFPRL